MPARAVRGAVAGAVALACLAGLGLASARTAGEVHPLPDIEASRYLPADGGALLFRRPTGQGVGVLEHAVGDLTALTASLPGTLDGLRRVDPDAGAPGQTWWRETAFDEEFAEKNTRFHTVTRAGIELRRVGLAFEGEVVFGPGAVVLPATAAPGTSWQARGAASARGWAEEPVVPTDWELRGRVLTEPYHDPTGSSPDCRVVEVDLAVRLPGEDGVPAPQAFGFRAAWCPGRGIVSRTYSGTFDRVAFLPETLPDDRFALPPTIPGVTASDLASRRSLPADLAPALAVADRQRLGAVPWILQDRPVVLHPNGTDLVEVQIVEEQTESGRSVLTSVRGGLTHPGGRPTTVTTLGTSGLLITTSDRRLLAYGGPVGPLRHWATTLPDLAVAAPVAFRAGDREGIAVLTLGGTLTGYDRRTGREEWQLRVSGQVLAGAPDGSLVVADRSGRITLVSGTGAVTAAVAGPREPVGVALVDGRPISWGRDWVAAPAFAQRPAWSRSGAVAEVAGVEGDTWRRVAVRVAPGRDDSGGRVDLVDPDDGTVRGTHTPVRAMLALPGGLTVLSGDRVRSLDAAGRTVAELTLPDWDPAPDADVALRAGQTTVWVFARTPAGELTSFRIGRVWSS